MREKRLLLLLLVVVVCLSLWQISEPQIFVETSLPFSLYAENASSYVYPIQELQKDDYNRLINVTDFTFDILNQPCKNETSSLLLLVLVHTSPTNFAKRKTVRETWGQRRDNMKLLFMLGRVNYSSKIQDQLEEENRIYGDFVQGSFLDSYRNMTYKHVMVFKYAIYHCPQAKYLLKTDDDVFVNTPMIMDFLVQTLSPYGAKNLLLCDTYPNSRVLRSFRSKWRVGFDEFPDRYYPPYCPGWALLYSQDYLFALYKAAQQSKYYWIDDVHITGVLVKQLKLNHTNVQLYILGRSDTEDITNEIKIEPKPFLFGPANIDEKTIRALWKYITKSQENQKQITHHKKTSSQYYLNLS